MCESSFFRNNRNFINTFLTCAFLLAVISHSSVEAQTGKQLRYNLLPGEAISYSTLTDIKQTVGEMQFSMGTSISTNVDTKVESIENNNSTLSVAYRDTKITTSGMAMAGIADGTTNYDEFSNNNESLTLSDRGETISRILKSAKKAGKMSTVERNAQAAVKALGYMFTEFPQKPLKIGDSWVVTRNDTTGAKNENQIITLMKIQYTLQNYSDTLGIPCAVLKCKSLTSSMSGAMEMMGNSMNFEGDGSLAGKVYVEVSTGMTISSYINNQIDMRISMGGQDGMIIPVSVESKSTINRITNPINK